MGTANLSVNDLKLASLLPLIEIALIAVVLIVVFNFVLLIVKKGLLKRAKSKVQISNIKILTRIINIFVVLIIIVFSFLTYFKSWTGIGVFVGLISAALGFALQKPITGVAAWIMVVFKRPFQVGDRITLGNIKGDVYDITLTHLYIDEVGGGIETEQHSGSNVMIPNYKLFEENIINHTLIHDYVLEEVVYTITYDSNLDKAMDLGLKEARKLTDKFNKEINKDSSVRVSMVDSGVKIRIIFFAPVQQTSRIKSDLTKNIYDSIRKEKNIELAYPRREITIKKD